MKKESFFASVKNEMKIVTWPSKQKLRKDFVTVVQSTLIFAAFFAIVDNAISFVLKLFM
ncbi:preprotein translocase subunit SecE [Vagococcus acidifermentans]|uniref:Protein translocase subunit SecE n=1 Tax=Vagococcus acidifermentans TaxID=564710 RepID=A0A430AWM1_9ENTE|nr:preprotein translocase subunit SecE [Vagococcus acidifermentans]RSU12443.1 preprotein translocase subunit SecE [Vagococcus acidifermentans]